MMYQDIYDRICQNTKNEDLQPIMLNLSRVLSIKLELMIWAYIEYLLITWINFHPRIDK